MTMKRFSFLALLAVFPFAACHRDTSAASTPPSSSTQADEGVWPIELQTESTALGTFISWVYLGSPAEKAGIRVGDRFVDDHSAGGELLIGMTLGRNDLPRIDMSLVHPDGIAYSVSYENSRVSSDVQADQKFQAEAARSVSRRIRSGTSPSDLIQPQFIPIPGYAAMTLVVPVQGFSQPILVVADGNIHTAIPAGTGDLEERARQGYVTALKAYSYATGPGWSELHALVASRGGYLPYSQPVTLLWLSTMAPTSFSDPVHAGPPLLQSHPGVIAEGRLAGWFGATDAQHYPFSVDLQTPEGNLPFTRGLKDGIRPEEVEAVAAAARKLQDEWSIILDAGVKWAALQATEIQSAKTANGISIDPAPAQAGPGYLGANLAVGPGGIIVMGAVPGSPASTCLRQGDVLQFLNGTPLPPNPAVILSRIAALPPGTAANIYLYRPGQGHVMVHPVIAARPGN